LTACRLGDTVAISEKKSGLKNLFAIPDGIRTLVAERQAAREVKDWTDADAARERLQALGYEVEDTPAGPQIRRRKSPPVDS